MWTPSDSLDVDGSTRFHQSLIKISLDTLVITVPKKIGFYQLLELLDDSVNCRIKYCGNF